MGVMREPNDPTPYQKHLAAWRIARDMTLEEAAEKLDVAHTTVSRWERGELPISSRRLVDLCRLYTVTPAQLLISPEEAQAEARLAEIRALLDGIDPEAYDHLKYVAARLKGVP